MFWPKKAYCSVGVDAIACSVACTAPPKPTAKISTLPVARMLLATEMAVASLPSTVCAPSESSMITRFAVAARLPAPSSTASAAVRPSEIEVPPAVL